MLYYSRLPDINKLEEDPIAQQTYYLRAYLLFQPFREDAVRSPSPLYSDLRLNARSVWFNSGAASRVTLTCDVARILANMQEYWLGVRAKRNSPYMQEDAAADGDADAGTRRAEKTGNGNGNAYDDAAFDVSLIGLGPEDPDSDLDEANQENDQMRVYRGSQEEAPNAYSDGECELTYSDSDFADAMKKCSDRDADRVCDALDALVAYGAMEVQAMPLVRPIDKQTNIIIRTQEDEKRDRAERAVARKHLKAKNMKSPLKALQFCHALTRLDVDSAVAAAAASAAAASIGRRGTPGTGWSFVPPAFTPIRSFGFWLTNELEPTAPKQSITLDGISPQVKTHIGRLMNKRMRLQQQMEADANHSLCRTQIDAEAAVRVITAVREFYDLHDKQCEMFLIIARMFFSIHFRLDLLPLIDASVLSPLPFPVDVSAGTGTIPVPVTGMGTMGTVDGDGNGDGNGDVDPIPGFDPNGIGTRTVPAPAPAPAPDHDDDQPNSPYVAAPPGMHSDAMSQSAVHAVLCGAAGTGKSRVINAIRNLYDLFDLSDSVVVCAYSGSAAIAVGGSTIHSELRIPVMIGSKSKSSLCPSRVEDDQRARWSTVSLLIIDEFSFVSAAMLQTIDDFMRPLGAQPTKCFGGINLLMVGDFHQLPPPRETSLMGKNTAAQESTSAPIIQSGLRLWRGSFTTVITLEKQMRQANDPEFASHLQVIRDGRVTQNTVDYINRAYKRDQSENRGQPILPSPLIWLPSFVAASASASVSASGSVSVVSPLGASPDSLKSFTSIIVATNDARIQLNRQIVVSMARRFFAQDTTAECPFLLIRGIHTRPKTANKRHPLSTQNQMRADKAQPPNGFDLDLYLYIGLQVIITETMCLPLSIANGTRAVVDGIELECDADSHVWVDSATPIRLFPSTSVAAIIVRLMVGEYLSNAQLVNGLKPGQFRILRQMKNYIVKTPGLPDLPVRLYQFPILSAHAVTAHRFQGLTVDRLIIGDTSSHTDRHLYVSLSRVTSLAGLTLLQPVPPPEHKSWQISTALIKETKRLAGFQRNTEIQWNRFFIAMKNRGVFDTSYQTSNGRSADRLFASVGNTKVTGAVVGSATVTVPGPVAASAAAATGTVSAPPGHLDAADAAAAVADDPHLHADPDSDVVMVDCRPQAGSGSSIAAAPPPSIRKVPIPSPSRSSSVVSSTATVFSVPSPAIRIQNICDHLERTLKEEERELWQQFETKMGRIIHIKEMGEEEKNKWIQWCKNPIPSRQQQPRQIRDILTSDPLDETHKLVWMKELELDCSPVSSTPPAPFPRSSLFTLGANDVFLRVPPDLRSNSGLLSLLLSFLCHPTVIHDEASFMRGLYHLQCAGRQRKNQNTVTTTQQRETIQWPEWQNLPKGLDPLGFRQFLLAYLYSHRFPLNSSSGPGVNLLLASSLPRLSFGPSEGTPVGVTVTLTGTQAVQWYAYLVHRMTKWMREVLVAYLYACPINIGDDASYGVTSSSSSYSPGSLRYLLEPDCYLPLTVRQLRLVAVALRIDLRVNEGNIIDQTPVDLLAVEAKHAMATGTLDKPITVTIVRIDKESNLFAGTATVERDKSPLSVTVTVGTGPGVVPNPVPMSCPGSTPSDSSFVSLASWKSTRSVHWMNYTNSVLSALRKRYPAYPFRVPNINAASISTVTGAGAGADVDAGGNSNTTMVTRSGRVPWTEMAKANANSKTSESGNGNGNGNGNGCNQNHPPPDADSLDRWRQSIRVPVDSDETPLKVPGDGDCTIWSLLLSFLCRSDSLESSSSLSLQLDSLRLCISSSSPPPSDCIPICGFLCMSSFLFHPPDTPTFPDIRQIAIPIPIQMKTTNNVNGTQQNTTPIDILRFFLIQYRMAPNGYQWIMNAERHPTSSDVITRHYGSCISYLRNLVLWCRDVLVCHLFRYSSFADRGDAADVFFHRCWSDLLNQGGWLYDEEIALLAAKMRIRLTIRGTFFPPSQPLLESLPLPVGVTVVPIVIRFVTSIENTTPIEQPKCTENACLGNHFIATIQGKGKEHRFKLSQWPDFDPSLAVTPASTPHSTPVLSSSLPPLSGSGSGPVVPSPLSLSVASSTHSNDSNSHLVPSNKVKVAGVQSQSHWVATRLRSDLLPYYKPLAGAYDTPLAHPDDRFSVEDTIRLNQTLAGIRAQYAISWDKKCKVMKQKGEAQLKRVMMMATRSRVEKQIERDETRKRKQVEGGGGVSESDPDHPSHLIQSQLDAQPDVDMTLILSDTHHDDHDHSQSVSESDHSHIDSPLHVSKRARVESAVTHITHRGDDGSSISSHTEGDRESPPKSTSDDDPTGTVKDHDHLHDDMAMHLQPIDLTSEIDIDRDGEQQHHQEDEPQPEEDHRHGEDGDGDGDGGGAVVGLDTVSVVPLHFHPHLVKPTMEEIRQIARRQQQQQQPPQQTSVVHQQDESNIHTPIHTHAAVAAASAAGDTHTMITRGKATKKRTNTKKHRSKRTSKKRKGVSRFLDIEAEEDDDDDFSDESNKE